MKRAKLCFIVLFIVYSSSFIVLGQGTWTKKTNFPDTVRGYGVGFAIDSMGYIGLGYNANYSRAFNDFWQYTPKTNSWLRKADFPGRGRVWPAAFVIGHKAYVVTGAKDYSVYNCYKECWQYDATTDKWTQKANFPGTSRAIAVGFSIGNKGYVGTGYDSAGNTYKDFWQYDTATDNWTQKANFGGGKRFGSSGYIINGKGYVCLGSDSTYKMLNDLWVYDTGSNSWTQKASYPDTPVYSATGFVIGTNMYVGTGGSFSAFYCYKYFWQYNTLKDIWTKQTDFSGYKRGVASSFAIGNYGYLGLGNYGDTLFFNDLYQFNPDTLTGISEALSKRDDIKVYPNPFNTHADIIIPNTHIYSNELTIKCYDMLSREYNIEYTVLYGGANTKIQVQRVNLEDGLYIIKLSYFNMTNYTKLIINH